MAEGRMRGAFYASISARNSYYFRWSIDLGHGGSVIIVDNVVRDGALADANTKDEAFIGVRRLHELIRNEPRVTATTTVGMKGYDGFTMAVVN